MSFSRRPFLGLCVIFRDNIDTLPKLLESVAGHFDDYTFTDTGSVDGSRSLIEAFLGDHRGRITDFDWCDDFGKARQANFNNSPARWSCFLDTDDVLVDGANVRQLLLKAEISNPEISGWFVPYQYDRLEKLDTMRLIKRSPDRQGWLWRDAIHERLEYDYGDGEGLPRDAYAHTEEFRVLHRPKTNDEKNAAIRRNATIARREYAATTDEKYRARLARTIAMELKMEGKSAESIPFLEELHRCYTNYPEGRQGAADMHRAYMYIGDGAKDPVAGKAALDRALTWAAKAGPAYEAISHHTRAMAKKKSGAMAAARADFKSVLKAAQRSLGRSGNQTTHEGFVYEKAAVYLAAASSAVELDLKDKYEVAEQCLNLIPPTLRNEAAIAEWVGPIRAAIDRVTILVPGTPQPFDENGGGGMLGGSEECVMYLSRALAEAGRNVRVFTVLPPHRLPGKDRFGVDWQPVTTFDPDNEQGTLALWRAPHVVLELAKKAGDMGRPFAGILQAYLWLHDAGLGIPAGAAARVGEMCNGAVVLSEYHAQCIRKAGYVGPMFKAANGIVEEDFAPFIAGKGFGTARDQFSVVYSSCPSRGLVPLLEMWPAVKAAVPKARLDIYYDWSMLQEMQPRVFERVTKAMAAVDGMDVKHHGGVDHTTLGAALRKANVWAYSHFESPQVETFCISAVKAQAAGATVLTVPNGALSEVTAGDAYLVKDVEVYRDALIELLKRPQPVAARRAVARRALKRYGWKTVALMFSRLWSIRGPLETRIGSAPETEQKDLVGQTPEATVHP